MDKLIMIEIYSGKDPVWQGWHNLIMTNGNPEENIPIAGPLHPDTSKRLLALINQDEVDCGN